ncbi:MAG: mononuclear molybdenum enzyme YedY, partial [Gammaproteobacteria bacterium]|nr:mononuclear molybdenum enzyme YedY [Gammaproteobacteria bacterium]
MLIKRPSDIKPSEITSETIYRNRREFLKDGSGLLLGAAASALSSGLAVGQYGDSLKARAPEGIRVGTQAPWMVSKFKSIKPAPDNEPFYTEEELTPFEDVTKYNNFYEFGMNKGDPSSNSNEFKVEPWSVEITGEVAKPGRYNLEDIIEPHSLEERIYRLRCVEAWSM